MKNRVEKISFLSRSRDFSRSILICVPRRWPSIFILRLLAMDIRTRFCLLNVFRIVRMNYSNLSLSIYVGCWWRILKRFGLIISPTRDNISLWPLLSPSRKLLEEGERGMSTVPAVSSRFLFTRRVIWMEIISYYNDTLPPLFNFVSERLEYRRYRSILSLLFIHST